jgi:hypothetical protein
METNDKILIIGVLIFIVIGFGYAIYDKNVCDPEWHTIEENLDYLTTPNSIVEIKLYKAYPDFDINLVDDTVTISNRADIEQIQRMINNRYSGTWNRLTASWNTKMRLILDNQRTFDFMVSKIKNSKSEDLTHLYFGSTHCSDSSPSCSETLGTYLENLTAYKLKLD